VLEVARPRGCCKLGWRWVEVERAIHHERDVREEQPLVIYVWREQALIE